MASPDELRIARATYYEATLRYASATGTIHRRVHAGAAPTPRELQEEQDALQHLQAAKQRYVATSSLIRRDATS